MTIVDGKFVIKRSVNMDRILLLKMEQSLKEKEFVL